MAYSRSQTSNAVLLGSMISSRLSAIFLPAISCMINLLFPLPGKFITFWSHRSWLRCSRGNFVFTVSFFREILKLFHDCFRFRARIKEAHGADFAVRADFVDVELFHESLPGFGHLVAGLLSLLHKALESLRMRPHVIWTDVDAQMAVFIAQARIGVAFLQIDEPALDAVRHYGLLGNGVAGTVEHAGVTVRAEVLDAELAGPVLGEGQIGGYEARAKTGAVFFVDQAAVAPELPEAHLIKNGNRLDGAPPLLVPHRKN